MADGNWIKLNRGMADWGWYSDANTTRVFLDILLHATYKPREFMGYKLEAGQTIIGRKEMADRLLLSEQNVRTALKHLQSTGEITLKSTSRFSVATVANWAKYQCDDTEANQQLTNNQPTTNQQLTNDQPTANHIQKRKKERRKEYIYIYYGDFQNVQLTEDEYEKLKERFPRDYQQRINNLSTYIASTGKKYKSHYATILAWSRRDAERSTEQKKAEPKPNWKPFEKTEHVDAVEMPEEIRQKLKGVIKA